MKVYQDGSIDDFDESDEAREIEADNQEWLYEQHELNEEYKQNE